MQNRRGRIQNLGKANRPQKAAEKGLNRRLQRPQRREELAKVGEEAADCFAKKG